MNGRCHFGEGDAPQTVSKFSRTRAVGAIAGHDSTLRTTITDAMSGRDIVVIGASAGGIEALISLLGALPHGLGAAVFITVHRRRGGRDSLAQTLRPRSKLPLHTPLDGERFRRGVCYVCAPDAHLVVERGRVRSEPSPREYLHRPSIDALFLAKDHVHYAANGHAKLRGEQSFVATNGHCFDNRPTACCPDARFLALPRRRDFLPAKQLSF